MNTDPKIAAKFMRPRRYADRVGINWRTCYGYIEKGILPAYKFEGVVLIDVDEADAIIKGLVRHVSIPIKGRKPGRSPRRMAGTR